MCIFVSVCCFPLIYKLEENGAQNPHSDRHGWILCIPEPDKSSWIRYFSSDSLRDPNLQGWRWRVGMLNYIFTKNQEKRRKGGIGFAIRTCGIIRGSVKFKTGSVTFTKCIWMQKAKVFESETKSPILGFFFSSSSERWVRPRDPTTHILICLSTLSSATLVRVVFCACPCHTHDGGGRKILNTGNIWWVYHFFCLVALLFSFFFFFSCGILVTSFLLTITITAPRKIPLNLP